MYYQVEKVIVDISQSIEIFRIMCDRILFHISVLLQSLRLGIYHLLLYQLVEELWYAHCYLSLMDCLQAKRGNDFYPSSHFYSSLRRFSF